MGPTTPNSLLGMGYVGVVGDDSWSQHNSDLECGCGLARMSNDV
jgi:hypothetical protein